MSLLKTLPMLCCITVLLVCGCTNQSSPSAPVPSDGADMVAPQQLQAALQQLRSARPQDQLSGLAFLERFPSVAQSQAEQVAQLARSGANDSVKRKATAMLEKMPSSEP